MRLRPLALALLLLALPLAGCFGPKASLTMTVQQFSVDPNTATNRTRVGAQVLVRAEAADVQLGMMLWAMDAARNILLAAEPLQVKILAGESAVLNYSEDVNGIGFPVKFLLHGGELRAEAWPAVDLLGHPLLSRLNTPGGAWNTSITQSLDRQNLHLVVDNTHVATDPTAEVAGEITVLVNGQPRAGPRQVQLAPGAHLDLPLVVRLDERVEVRWRGPAVDVLAYVGDGVYERYQAEASRFAGP